MAYMSPEQAGSAETDSRTDIWSLGVVLYEMVAGQPPFRGDYDQVVVYSLMNEDPEPLTAVRTGVPKELERIVNRCLAKEPSGRYQDVNELLVDLRELRNEQQVEAATRARPAPTSAPTSAAAPQPHRTPWLLVGAAVLIALVTATGVFLGLFESKQPASEQKPLKAVPLTSYTGSEEHPTFSPDGARVAFAWDGESQNNFDIYVKEIDAENHQRLTTDPSADNHPSWSPDGRFIAFLRLDPGENKAKVVIIPFIGGPERVVGDTFVTHRYGGAQTLAWSPDSKQLVIADSSSPDGARALFLLSIQTGEKRRLTSPVGAWGDSSPALSPDGKTLAFIKTASVFARDVFLLSLNADLSPAAEPRRLTSIGNLMSGLSWSADGESIVFSSGSDPDTARLWKIPVSGGDARPVAAAGLGSSDAAISGPTRRLAFARLTADSNVWEIRLGASGSTDPVKLFSSTRFDGAAYYSPEGTRITFTSGRTGTTGIWLSDADGSNPKPLFLHPEGAFSGSGQFSPDGQHVAFDSYADGNGDIFVISVSGGKPFRLTTHPGDDQVPSWSTDGKWVYFSSARTGRFEIWKAPAGGGEPTQVTTNGGRFALMDPAGEFLYYVKTLEDSENALWKTPVSGREESKVLESVVSRNFAGAAGGIYFMQAPHQDGPARAHSIRFLNLEEGRVEIIARLPSITIPLPQGLDVSPEGQSILYTQGDDISSDLMLIEGFE
jgi:Tol biopolymer transport system component